jgi:hypothetical protein
MRLGWVGVVAAVACVPGLAFAQLPTPLTPLAPGPGEGPPLPDGTAVSRPLTPVEIPPAPPPDVPPELPPEQTAGPIQRVEEVQQQKYVRRGPLGPAWDELEFLLWWPKAHPLPPLVAATRTGSPPVLGGPDTVLLVGNRAIDTQDVAGGRFTIGWALNERQTVGFELRYFFLGSRTFKTTVTQMGNPRVRALGVPFVNALTGREDVFATGVPGVSAGSIHATATTRVQGAEANAVANLVDGKNGRLNAIIGYRFLQVHEGVTVEQLRFAPSGFGPIYDQFDAHNRFHGAQLGLHADLSRGVLFCELTGKVALGRVCEVVKIDGATGLRTPVPGGIIDTPLPGGVLALPTNIGRTTHGTFAVVPEGTFKIGLRFSESGRIYVGYNFLYLSDAVRPGDQIDRTINPAQIPSLGQVSAMGFIGPDRPRAGFARSDFWVQGLVMGL